MLYNQPNLNNAFTGVLDNSFSENFCKILEKPAIETFFSKVPGLGQGRNFSEKKS